MQAADAEPGPVPAAQFAADEEVGPALAAVDWAATPLGLPGSWPQSLQTAVDILLSSRFPMWMAWGPRLTFFCNAAYRRDTLGRKYPWALGKPASEVWEEIWHDIGPRVDAVLATGKATWDEALLLFPERSGYPEETYHTFSYSPLRDEAGAVAGMLCVVSEDTDRIIAERRMATLRDLGSAPRAARTERETLEFAGRQLDRNQLDLPFTLTYLFADDGASARLAGMTGIAPGHPAAPAALAAGDPDPLWPVAAPLRGDVTLVDLAGPRFAGLPAGAWREPPVQALIAPLVRQGGVAYGFLVAALNRYRPLDEGYRAFIGLVAGYLAAGIASGRSYRDQQRRREEELAELVQAREVALTLQHAILAPTGLPHGFAARYTPAVPPLEVGGDWYDVVPLPGQRTGVVAGDCVGRGLAAAAVMGQLRSASQAVLLRAPGPAQALGDLDTFASRIPGAECTTVFCAIIDHEDGTVTYSCAGHPPPILVTAAGEHQFLDQAQSLPLGMLPAGGQRGQARTPLPLGATLLLYTDGLVERRGQPLEKGIDAAAALVDAHAQAPPDLVADYVMSGMAPAAGYEDDVAILVYRRPAAALAASMPASDPSCLAVLRARLREWLPAAGIGAPLASDIMIAAGEAVGNAFEHATAGRPAGAAPVQITLTARASHAMIQLVIADNGSWRPPAADRERPAPGTRGHGIIFMHAIMDDVTIDRSEHGTTVTLTKDLKA